MSADGQQVLLMHRNKRADDVHYGKYNGLGGKLDRNEDIVSGMRREIREEAGIEALDLVLRGTISWPGFGKNGEDWFGFLFRIDTWTGQVSQGNHEGVLEWVNINELDAVKFWESDRCWLDMVFERSNQTFHGLAPFHDNEPVSWSCVRL